MDFTGKTVLVIGAAAPPWGYEVAKRFVSKGAKAILSPVTSDPKTTAKFAKTGIRLEMLNLYDPEQWVASFAPIHIVVIAPMRFRQTAFIQTTAEEWELALLHNFEQMTFAMQAAAKVMIEGGQGGRIIVLSSVAALKPLRGLSAFGTTLAALHAMARMAAVDLAPYHITVNIVATAWRDPWMIDPLADGDENLLQAHIPLGTLGTANDVADLSCFLASEQAGYITGAIIPVDGGYSIAKAGVGTPPR